MKSFSKRISKYKVFEANIHRYKKLFIGILLESTFGTKTSHERIWFTLGLIWFIIDIGVYDTRHAEDLPT